MWTALLLDDVERPSTLDEDEDFLGDHESMRPPEDEDHMLARMVGHGGREDGARVEGEELLDDVPTGDPFDCDWDGE